MPNTTTKKKAGKRNGSPNEETGQVAKHHKGSKAKEGNVLMPAKDERSPDKSVASKLDPVVLKLEKGLPKTSDDDNGIVARHVVTPEKTGKQVRIIDSWFYICRCGISNIVDNSTSYLSTPGEQWRNWY
jgi:hypothetical protein